MDLSYTWMNGIAIMFEHWSNIEFKYYFCGLNDYKLPPSTLVGIVNYIFNLVSWGSTLFY